VGAARIEPDVENIELLQKLRATALPAAGTFRQELLRRMSIPGVGTLLFEDGGDVMNIFAVV